MMERNNRRRQDGFTLVEIMVVVVILGLLAGVGIVGARRYLDKAKVDTAASRCAEIEKAIELEETSGGRFDDAGMILDQLVETKALKKDGITDSWGTRFEVRRDEDGEFFVISAGPDRQLDTADDIGRKGTLAESPDSNF